MAYKKIIDVSYWNGSIDWKKVKNAGIYGAIIRAGYGDVDVDSKYAEHIKGAVSAGLHIGIYWFSYAWNTAMAKAEAQKCMRTVKAYKDKIDLGIWYDAEYDTFSYASKMGHSLSNSTLNSMAVAFCDKIKKNGYTTGIYFNQDYRKNRFTSATLNKYMKWYAWYNSALDCKTSEVDIWQYSSTENVSGVGKCDVNWLVDESIVKKSGSSGSTAAKKSTPTTKKKESSADKKKKTVKALQAALNASYKCGLAVDGSCGPLTKAQINKHYLYYKSTTIKNEHVKWIQKALNELGYGLTVDGSYGPATRDAVKKFQKKYGLAVDGYSGVDTHMKLLTLL